MASQFASPPSKMSALASLELPVHAPLEIVVTPTSWTLIAALRNLCFAKDAIPGYLDVHFCLID